MPSNTIRILPNAIPPQHTRTHTWSHPFLHQSNGQTVWEGARVQVLPNLGASQRTVGRALASAALWTWGSWTSQQRAGWGISSSPRDVAFFGLIAKTCTFKTPKNTTKKCVEKKSLFVKPLSFLGRKKNTLRNRLLKISLASLSSPEIYYIFHNRLIEFSGRKSPPLFRQNQEMATSLKVPPPKLLADPTLFPARSAQKPGEPNGHLSHGVANLKLGRKKTPPTGKIITPEEKNTVSLHPAPKLLLFW